MTDPLGNLRGRIASVAEEALDASIRARSQYPAHTWADIEAVADAVVPVVIEAIDGVLQYGGQGSRDLLEAWAAVKTERETLKAEVETLVSLARISLSRLDGKP